MRGIYTLEDVRLRCVIDDITGCWRWRYSSNACGIPHCHVPAGVLGPKRMSCSARRAAWALAGKRLPDGCAIYPACGHADCVNPTHLARGTTGDALRASNKDRRSMSTPRRLAALAAYRERWTIPAETIRAIEQALRAGLTAKAAAEHVGVRYAIAKQVRRGEHAHQRAKVLRGASVFAWRPQ